MDTLQEVLQIQYDSTRQFKNKLLLHKNGLIAVYPLSEKVRYESLGEAKYNFLRFVLPNKKRGWLSLETGQEYIDE